MNNLESGVGAQEPKPQFRGREAVSIESVLKMQITLMQLMVPEALQQYVGTSNGMVVGIEDALFNRWAGKYAVPFKEFCDEHANDKALLGRIESQRLKARDFNKMRRMIIQKVGPFFLDEAEISEFLKRYTH